MEFNTKWAQETLPILHDLCLQAGDAIMEIYRSDFQVEYKDDKMPVTEADRAAEAIIIKGLRAINPDWAIVAEESSSLNGAPKVEGRYFWLVDPLDGTREFMARNGEFTVNIALIQDCIPVMGIIYAPAIGLVYTGIQGLNAQKCKLDDDQGYAPISAKRVDDDGAIMVGSSRNHRSTHNLQLLIQEQTLKARLNMGSSLKFCLIAEGNADFYPRLGRTMEWDTAAGHAILNAAGGSVTHIDGAPFLYHKNPIFENPAFIARGKLS
ncbi:MAG: 3'(2'),5'-bisphosphate nucleotidase CysQ [Alphaproteobacteria bacterium]